MAWVALGVTTASCACPDEELGEMTLVRAGGGCWGAEAGLRLSLAGQRCPDCSIACPGLSEGWQLLAQPLRRRVTFGSSPGSWGEGCSRVLGTQLRCWTSPIAGVSACLFLCFRAHGKIGKTQGGGGGGGIRAFRPRRGSTVAKCSFVFSGIKFLWGKQIPIAAVALGPAAVAHACLSSRLLLKFWHDWCQGLCSLLCEGTRGKLRCG